jgi:hypothetical protein
VDEVADELPDRTALEGARRYRKRRIGTISSRDVERLARAMLARGPAPKTARNVMTFLHSVSALALENGHVRRNAVDHLRTRCVDICLDEGGVSP